MMMKIHTHINEEENIGEARPQGQFSQNLVEKTFYIYTSKIKHAASRCIKCTLSEAKAKKRKGFLEPKQKEDIQLGLIMLIT